MGGEGGGRGREEESEEIDWFAQKGGFKSTWARSLDKELAATNTTVDNLNDERDSDRDHDRDRDCEREREKVRKENEEQRRKKEERERERRRVAEAEQKKKWEKNRMETADKAAHRVEAQKLSEKEKAFGLDTDSSSSSDTNEEEYDTIDRKAKNLEKKRKTQLRRKWTRTETMRKANLIVGIGHVEQEDIVRQRTNSRDYNEAKKKAAIHYLRTKLMYNDEEVEKTVIKDTQMANDDTMYVAMTKNEDIREVYIRKAEVRDDDIWVRNFIPPQVFARFMFLSNACKSYREKYKDMKTQIRIRPQ